MMRRLTFIIIAAGLWVGCQRSPEPSPSPTAAPLAAIDGTLAPVEDGESVEGVPVALCRLADDAITVPAPCAVQAGVVFTNSMGHFTFPQVEPGQYLVLYGFDAAAFTTAVEGWQGQTIRPGDWAWVRDTIVANSACGVPNVLLPEGLTGPASPSGSAQYAVDTLMIEGAPAIIGHQVVVTGTALSANPVELDVLPGETASPVIPANRPAQPDLDAIRSEIGPLAREEAPLFDRDLAARWQQFIDGDDCAYHDTDATLIEAVRGIASSRLYEIGNAFFATQEEAEGQLVKRIGYETIDVQSGQPVMIGWLDSSTGDVVEISTSYRLNVRDAPGEWVESGPSGEQFYHYGFSFFRRWGQILPDPVIAEINAFATTGADYVAAHLEDYQSVAASFGGDLSLIDWDDALPGRMRAWQPVTPPFVHLPDSGTVDIRRERFFDAVLNGAVVVDRTSVDAFLISDAAKSGAFDKKPEAQDVIDALLTPYRSGQLYSDLEAAIILDATYGGNSKPLTIVITDQLSQGFQVPRGGGKVVRVAQSEVANVLLGYWGVINSRWPHEMGHIVDFRAEEFDFHGRPEEGSRCEPAKYLMEFDWWIERYPGDAPDWDWLPINSGLTLARMLDERYHNSGC